MNWLHALLLGLLQGLTEFFPVSSSAHLKFLKTLLGVSHGEETVIFDLFCHLGTLVALTLYFRREIIDLLFYHPRRMLPFIIGLIPLVPFYFLLKPVRDALSKPEFLGFCLMGTAALLFLASLIKIREKKELGLKDALWIGTFQGVALIPGISRSAATIGAGLWRGATAFEAVRFSFLLSLPAVLGGTFLELFKARDHFAHIEWSPCITGFAAATIMGLATVRLAIPLLQKGILRPFAWYCLIAGTVITLYLYG